jgi:hypothetical protein
MSTAGQDFRIALLVLAALAAAVTIAPQRAWAQTPAKMGYARSRTTGNPAD